jgi:hypothetical protein
MLDQSTTMRSGRVSRDGFLTSEKKGEITENPDLTILDW